MVPVTVTGVDKWADGVVQVRAESTEVAIVQEMLNNDVYLKNLVDTAGTDLGTLTDRVDAVEDDGDVNLATGKVFKVNDVQVLGAQAAAEADVTGGSTIDAEARTTLNSLLAKLRTHGIIAT